ncbi:MAG: hypothetical protein R3282_08550, partial [Rhodothermales bacterium]|nr:hypothetical protein [Rhodothermales bacterium]
MVTFQLPCGWSAFNSSRHCGLAVAVWALLASVVVVPFSASAQGIESLLERERQLVERVDLEQSVNGPYSEDLIGPLTTLSLFYEEIGDHQRADATTMRVLQVVRANYGLYSLEQAPPIRQLIARAQDRGNAAAAWELEQELLALAERHEGDLRTARIFLDTAERRQDILERFGAGEIPPEIILGCYYRDNDTQEARLRGPTPMVTTQLNNSTQQCEAGSRPLARQALAGETQWYFMRVVEVILENEGYASEALLEPLTALTRSSYLYLNPGLGRSTLEHL